MGTGWQWRGLRGSTRRRVKPRARLAVTIKGRRTGGLVEERMEVLSAKAHCVGLALSAISLPGPDNPILDRLLIHGRSAAAYISVCAYSQMLLLSTLFAITVSEMIGVWLVVDGASDAHQYC